MHSFSSACLISAFALTLSACASVPSQDQLVSGIDKTQLAQAGATKRAASDPVCVDFYSNVAEFEKNAQSNRGTKNFFSSIGLNVASAVLVGQVLPVSGISSQTGRIAAATAASTATRQGGSLALRELNSSKRADRKIIDVAADIGCPVNIKP